jgi:hypothetical protein
MEHIIFEKILMDMRQEISRHKWLESEKAGRDVGFEFAHTDWAQKHFVKWLHEWRLKHYETS